MSVLRCVLPSQTNADKWRTYFVCTTEAERPTTGLTEGELAYSADTDTLSSWDGAAWNNVSPVYKGVAVAKSETTTLLNVTWTTITFDGVEEFDSDGYHNSAVNPSRITIPAGLGGKYLLTGTIEFGSNATGERFVRVLKNGAVLRQNLSWLGPHGGGNFLCVPFAMVANLVATDYVEVQAFQSSGVSLASTDTSTWQATLVGR